MVEVFRTNVKNRLHADLIIDLIHKTFTGYKANFDLNDRDNILRVKCTTQSIQSTLLIRLIKDFGFLVEVLPDYPVVAKTSGAPTFDDHDQVPHLQDGNEGKIEHF